MAKKKIIEVDLLEEFSDDELVDELKSRGYDFEDECECEDHDISDYDTGELISELEDRGYPVLEAENVIDTLKLEVIRDNMDSVTLDQLEAFFKSPQEAAKQIDYVQQLEQENRELQDKVDDLELRIMELE